MKCVEFICPVLRLIYFCSSFPALYFVDLTVFCLFMTDTNARIPALCLRQHFNYYSVDSALGHLVFSLKYNVIADQEQEHLDLFFFPLNVQEDLGRFIGQMYKAEMEQDIH